MKKLLALLLSLVLVLGLAACGNNSSNNNAGDNGSQTQQPDSPEDGENAGDSDVQEPTVPDGEDGDVSDSGEDSNAPSDGDAADSGNNGNSGSTGGSGDAGKPETAGMTLSRTDFTLFSAGATYRLTVSGVEGTCTFTSSNTDVATVASDGTVTAVAPGNATITVTCGEQKASCIVRCSFKETGSEEPETPENPDTPEQPETDSVDLSAFYSDMTSQYTFGSLTQFTGDVLESYYPGLGAVDTKQCLVMGTMMTMNNGEFCLVEVSDNADVDTVKGIFQARIDYMADGGAWYPAATEQWASNSRVVSNGNYVMMVVNESCDAIVDAFNALFA